MVPVNNGWLFNLEFESIVKFMKKGISPKNGLRKIPELLFNASASTFF